jgi:hypothetical protein
MSASLQTHTLNDGERTTTTYSRADLGIDTAIITNTTKRRWTVHLLDGPEPDERTSHTVELESTADQLATQHSLSCF